MSNENHNKEDKTYVINLFGGPGVGKSTTAAGLFSMFKLANVSCELVTEFAKDVVWAEHFEDLNDQIWIFANQYRRMNVLRNKVKVIITDSPLLLTLAYNKNNVYLDNLALEEFNKFNNLNFVLSRNKQYEQKGRIQDLERAKGIDRKVNDIITFTATPVITIPYGEKSIKKIFKHVMKVIKNDN